jgi:hypothetical protein
MASDDDDGSVIIIQGKIKKALTAPVAAKRWHFIVVAVVFLVIGLVL